MRCEVKELIYWEYDNDAIVTWNACCLQEGAMQEGHYSVSPSFLTPACCLPTVPVILRKRKSRCIAMSELFVGGSATSPPLRCKTKRRYSKYLGWRSLALVEWARKLPNSFCDPCIAVLLCLSTWGRAEADFLIPWWSHQHRTKIWKESTQPILTSLNLNFDWVLWIELMLSS